MSSMKSTPTENWDDDFLFQLTPSKSKSKPRSRSKSRPVPSRKFTEQPVGSPSRLQERDQDEGGLQGLFSGRGRDEEREEIRYPGVNNQDEEGDEEEEEEDWDVELEIDSPTPDPEFETAPAYQNASSTWGSSLLPPPLPVTVTSTMRKNVSQSDLPSNLAEGPNSLQDQLEKSKTSDSTSPNKEKKKEYRKSYHGQASSKVVPPVDSLPVPSGSRYPQSQLYPQTHQQQQLQQHPPSAFNRPKSNSTSHPNPTSASPSHETQTGSSSFKNGNEPSKKNPAVPGKGKSKGMMERVANLHRRFSSTSTPPSAAVGSVSRSGAGSELRSERPGLRVQTSSTMAGTNMGRSKGPISPPLPLPTPLPQRTSSRTSNGNGNGNGNGNVGRPDMPTRIVTSQSAHSIHSVISGSTSASSNLNLGMGMGVGMRVGPGVVDGLPGSRRPSGASVSSSGGTGFGSPNLSLGSGGQTSPTLVSVGFHLPSPSPASPYYQQQQFLQERSQADGQERNGEMEEVILGDSQKTPKGVVSARGTEGAGPRKVSSGDENRHVSGASQTSRGTMGTVGTVRTVFMIDDMDKEVDRLDADRMRGFKMGGTRVESDRPSIERGQSDDKTLPPAILPLPLDKKRKSTLKRLSSLSKRHGRKVSDGWRFVSGSSNSSIERKSFEAQQVVTPRTAPVSFAMQQQQQQRERGMASLPLPPLGSAFRLASPVDLSNPPTSVRSMKQTPSTTSSRVSSDPQVLRSAQDADKYDDRQRSPSSAGRRVSLSDLKIPSRVASAQKGVKEDGTNIRQFSAAVKDLKALVAQRAVLEARLTRTQSQDRSENRLSIDQDSEFWWTKAHLLITLGETGNASEPATPAIDDDDALKRERRITLASDHTPSPTLAQIDIPIRRSQTELRPLGSNVPRSESIQRLEPIKMLTSGGSMGRQEFSQQQVEMLREILHSSTGTLDPEQRSDLKDYGSALNKRSPRPPALSSRSTAKENRPLPLNIPLPPTPTGLEDPAAHGHVHPGAKLTKRRASRSGIFNLRDMWRTTSNSNSNTNSDMEMPRTPVSPVGLDYDRSMRAKLGLGKQASSARSPKSPGRPGLAGMFRRSSQSSALLLDSMPLDAKRPSPTSTGFPPVTGGEKKEGGVSGKMQALRRKSSRAVSHLSPSPGMNPDVPSPKIGMSDRSSTSSSLSDWDKTTGIVSPISPRKDFLSSPFSPPTRHSPPALETEDRDRTIGRSDSRRMLANLGVKPGTSSPRPCNQNRIHGSDEPTRLALTPENLGPLLQDARLTLAKCEQSLREIGMEAGRSK